MNMRTSCIAGPVPTMRIKSGTRSQSFPTSQTVGRSSATCEAPALALQLSMMHALQNTVIDVHKQHSSSPGGLMQTLAHAAWTGGGSCGWRCRSACSSWQLSLDGLVRFIHSHYGVLKLPVRVISMVSSKRTARMLGRRHQVQHPGEVPHPHHRPAGHLPRAAHVGREHRAQPDGWVGPLVCEARADSFPSCPSIEHWEQACFSPFKSSAWQNIFSPYEPMDQTPGSQG